MPPPKLQGDGGNFIPHFENDWAEGYVLCPVAISVRDPMKFRVGLDIIDLPPEKCPWALEHIMKDCK